MGVRFRRVCVVDYDIDYVNFIHIYKVTAIIILYFVSYKYCLRTIATHRY